MAKKQIDLRVAMNAISDVVQNRPLPLREFDQIYMKSGDMVMQTEFVANWVDDKHVAFIVNRRGVPTPIGTLSY